MPRNVNHERVGRYFVPIEGLTVPGDWDVGPVRVRRLDSAALDDLRLSMASLRSHDWFTDLLAERGTGTLAEVEATDRETAFERAAQVVDILRVLQHIRHFEYHLTQFGIAGEVHRGVLSYAVVEQDEGRAGYGISHRGEALGWTFSDADEWVNGGPLRWVAEGIGVAALPEAHRRALTGVQLLSDALIEQRAGVKMMLLVTTLEAWLLPDDRVGQTYRLARAVAFFGCGRQEANLCGRPRNTCPYLELDPANTKDRAKLKRLRTAGATPPWLCSEWHRVVDWYDDRSAFVHGRQISFSYKDAENATYWVLRYLAEPILQWLQDHLIEPIADLDATIAALPPGPNWESKLGPLPSTSAGDG